MAKLSGPSEFEIFVEKQAFAQNFRASLDSTGCQDGHSLRALAETKKLAENSGIWNFLDRFVITESNRFRPVWDFVVALLLIYTATAFPFHLAFIEFQVQRSEMVTVRRPEYAHWKFMNDTVDALFWCDLVLNFLISYTEHDLEVTNSKSIMKRYVTGFFILDLLGCMPAEAFRVLPEATETTSGNKALRFSRMHRIGRLVRLTRMARLLKLAKFSLWQSLLRTKLARFFSFILLLLLTVHVCACGWYVIAALHPLAETTWLARRTADTNGILLLDVDPYDPGTVWLHSMYFMITVFTSVGFGDISAATPLEVVYVMCVMLIGTLVNSLIAGNIIAVVTSVDSIAAKRAEVKSLTEQIGTHMKLTTKTSRRLQTWALDQQFVTEHKINQAAARRVLDKEMSPKLMILLAREMHRGKLATNEFLARCARFLDSYPAKILFQMALAVDEAHWKFGEAVFRVGDMPLNMFLVTNGTFAALGRDTWGPCNLYGYNTYFGDCELFLDIHKRTTTVKCMTEAAEALWLSKEDLFAVASDFPIWGQIFKSEARRRFWRSNELHKSEKSHKDHIDLAVSRLQRWARSLPLSQQLHRPRLSTKWLRFSDANQKALAPADSRGALHVGALSNDLHQLQKQVSSILVDQSSTGDELRSHVNTRLDSMESKLDRLLARLEQQPGTPAAVASSKTEESSASALGSIVQIPVSLPDAADPPTSLLPSSGDEVAHVSPIDSKI